MNLGGWLLLTVLFSGIFLVIQRAERKRRAVTAVFMLIMAGVVWSYGIYRISGDCDAAWQALCRASLYTARFHTIAVTTAFWSVGAALIVNFLYWALFGRYNPVGSSDSIKVYGMDDI